MKSNASVLWFGEFLNRSRIMAPKSFDSLRSGTSDSLLSLRPSTDIFFSNKMSYSSLSLTALDVEMVSVSDAIYDMVSLSLRAPVSLKSLIIKWTCSFKAFFCQSFPLR